MNCFDLPEKDLSPIEQAQNLLLKLLWDPALPGGSPLKESVLARDFGINRPAIREALGIATGWGIVEYVPYCGYRKKDFTLKDLLAWSQLREGIEPIASGLLARRATEEVKEKLCAIIAAQDDAMAAENRDDFRKLDKEFHLCIVSNCGNCNFTSPGMLCYFDILFHLNGQCSSELLLQSLQDSQAPGHKSKQVKYHVFDNSMDDKWTIAGHRDILYNILMGDADEAENQTRRHIRYQSRNLQKLIDFYGNADLSLQQLLQGRKRHKNKQPQTSN